MCSGLEQEQGAWICKGTHFNIQQIEDVASILVYRKWGRVCRPLSTAEVHTTRERKRRRLKSPLTLCLGFPSSRWLLITTTREVCENPWTPRPRVPELDPSKHPAPGPGFLNWLWAVATSSALSVLCSRNSTINRCFHPRLWEIDSSNPERPDRSSQWNANTSLKQSSPGFFRSSINQLKIVQSKSVFPLGFNTDAQCFRKPPAQRLSHSTHRSEAS